MWKLLRDPESSIHNTALAALMTKEAAGPKPKAKGKAKAKAEISDLEISEI